MSSGPLPPAARVRHRVIESTEKRPVTISARTESMRAAVAAGITERPGLGTHRTTSEAVRNWIVGSIASRPCTRRARRRKACGTSITTEPSVTSGATVFWSPFAPMIQTPFDCRAAWKIPSPAASAFCPAKSF